MSIDSVQENKNKFIATTISLVIFSLFIVSLLLYSFISPNQEGITNSIEITKISGIEQLSGVIELENSSSEKHQLNSTENKSKNSSEKIDHINSKTNAEILRDNFIANRGRLDNTLESNKNNAQESLSNEPSSNKISNSLTGDENTYGIGINLIGRTVEASPKMEKDTKESGKIVVEIIVDKDGNVIKADPNGRGTTTNSSSLKQKAKKAALSTKFNKSVIEEQKGIITIIFSF